VKKKKVRKRTKASPLSMNEKFLAIIELSRSRVKKEGGIPSEEMRRRLGLD
jgi:hypothetical protein